MTMALVSSRDGPPKSNAVDLAIKIRYLTMISVGISVVTKILELARKIIMIMLRKVFSSMMRTCLETERH